MNDKDILESKNWLTVWHHYYDPEEKLEQNDPNAICVSSVDTEGMPNGRYVLLKDVSENGFLFYTNLKSQKGKELFGSKKGALTWWSRAQNKSVRVQGSVKQVSDEVANNYWSTRKEDAKISAILSKQSEEVTSRDQLEEEFTKLKVEYAGKEIPRPDHWSGVIISPQKIEFWEATDEYTSRLHNRFVFELQNDQWVTKRLYP
ncbi:pyridoxamine 5'-phosphate oxidase [bacterium]|jgi:pyridoxamine 5'-phosphate oxidase|nr:pyridoxamine 5'-phosphate oxidase [bacterium]|tara:strand:+ start:770 stop:1378 length:609 start_codon:yes stop_codon:yes gene_type:complete